MISALFLPKLCPFCKIHKEGKAYTNYKLETQTVYLNTYSKKAKQIPWLGGALGPFRCLGLCAIKLIQLDDKANHFECQSGQSYLNWSCIGRKLFV